MIGRELAPVIIGMSGHTDLEGKDAAVCRSLKAIFDCLDERYPSSPKILLTALATVADVRGAAEVLDRQEWEIVVPLPLPLDVYLREFDDRAATGLRDLVKQAGAQKNLRSFTLDPLRHNTEPRRLTYSEIAQGARSGNPPRADHDEQVGLFIAERCAVLIAVMRADHKPDRLGGTARVVRYRLRGTLDEAVSSYKPAKE